MGIEYTRIKKVFLSSEPSITSRHATVLYSQLFGFWACLVKFTGLTTERCNRATFRDGHTKSHS